MSEIIEDTNHPQLLVENVSFAWSRGKEAVKNCSFNIPRPGLWMLLGRNGSGKSTLFRLISGMLTPQNGSIDCYYIELANEEYQKLKIYTIN